MPPATKALLPLGAGAVRDRRNLPRKLHAFVRLHLVRTVVKATIPVLVGHQHTSLCVPQRNARRRTACTSTYANDAANALAEEMGGRNAQHAAQTRADARIQRVDAEVVQQLKLRADHVKNTQHGEACRIRRTVRIERVRARRTRAAIARAQHVCAHDEELVGVECLAWPNKVFPPPLARVPRRARCM